SISEMKHRVVITDEALQQVRQSYQWIEKNAPLAAARWFHNLMQTINSLESIPNRWPISPEGEAFGTDIRQLLYGKRQGVFRILFVVRGKTVTVLHVLHGSRQFL